MIKLFKEKESLSIGAAALFAECAEKSIKKKGRFSVALSGGNTPRRMYEILASPLYRDRIDWERADIFWGDERCVPLDDENSNYRMAFNALLGRVPIPQKNIHPVRCEGSPEEGAAAYERVLENYFDKSQPGFDLILLGLGENGHTASLFPGTRILRESEKRAVILDRHDEEFSRVTLTACTINQAAVIAFLVSGSSKASILKRTLEGPRIPDIIPAQLIIPAQGELFWLVDRNAASLLKTVLNS